MKGTRVFRNPSINFLIKKTLERKEGVLSKTGSLVVNTGKYTGRSPYDKFIVDTPGIHNKINWSKVNIPISKEFFTKLKSKIDVFFEKQKEIFIIDAQVGASKKHNIKVRVYCEFAYQALFATHLFRRLSKSQLKKFTQDLTAYCAPSVTSDPKSDGTNSEAFIVLNIHEKTILIGGSKYAGEIKKSVFSYMNFLLPQLGAFPMHCSANIESNGKTTALFFGLSGTGKTTLSADPDRSLIGDDEHGWDSEGVFNFEGGCYAKCIRLKKESEPQIWVAVKRKGALLENVVLEKNGDLNLDSDKYTENTRAVYPLDFIPNSVKSGCGKHPDYVLFLTADATGVLPPVAHLTLNQAAYHFLSGYTSKLAGTERGIVKPKPTFSAFFGGPFMPLKPMVYLRLLRDYLKKHGTKVYLVNTGWIGGGYGVGNRIPIKETRAIVSAILTGKIDEVDCHHDRIFNLFVPYDVPGANPEILSPINLWKDKEEYLKKANDLAKLFSENFKKFTGINEEIKNSGPKN